MRLDVQMPPYSQSPFDMSQARNQESGACCAGEQEIAMDSDRAWHAISTAPFDRDLELAVIEGVSVHALVFACRRILGGWANATTQERIAVRPTHWREWRSEG